MKIGENTFASISYTLTVEGQVVETVTEDRPLEFIYGMGFLLPQFESNLLNLGAGDKFNFKLNAENAYGEKIEEAIVELPKTIFMVEGAIEEGLLEIGNQLPMSDNQGNRMIGTVSAIGEESVTMDFNHPMAGKNLEFSGAVVAVREVTDEDMKQLEESCGCGCDSEEGCGSDCNSGCGCQ